jgi:hypothetical protein
VFSLKNKRFHKFVMAYSESSHQMQQKKKKKKKNCATRIYRWEHLKKALENLAWYMESLLKNAFLNFALKLRRKNLLILDKCTLF